MGKIQCWFFAWVLSVAVFGVSGKCCVNDDSSVAIANSVKQTLQEANANFFTPRSMRLEVLKQCPQAIPYIAQWLYDEWHPYDASLTVEQLICSFSGRLNDDRFPLTFVVLKEEDPIGVISLKNYTEPEFADLAEGTLWMGSLHVLPEERRQGVGQQLLQCVATVAKRCGCEQLYFYTSNPVNVKWYLQRGAAIVEERDFRHHKVTIMRMDLKAGIAYD